MHFNCDADYKHARESQCSGWMCCSINASSTTCFEAITGWQTWKTSTSCSSCCNSPWCVDLQLPLIFATTSKSCSSLNRQALQLLHSGSMRHSLHYGMDPCVWNNILCQLIQEWIQWNCENVPDTSATMKRYIHHPVLLKRCDYPLQLWMLHSWLLCTYLPPLSRADEAV